MRHFIVTLEFAVPFDQFGDAVVRHRAFLQEGFDQGLLLMSGPRTPRTGGVAIARAESLDQLESFFANDPYRLEGLATHSFQEFTPVKAQECVATWTNTASPAA